MMTQKQGAQGMMVIREMSMDWLQVQQLLLGQTEVAQVKVKVREIMRQP